MSEGAIVILITKLKSSIMKGDPIDGWEYDTYWIQAGSDGVAWQSGASYVDSDEIFLGLRKYTHNYDALLQIHDIAHHIIGIEFTANPDAVEDYLLKFRSNLS